MRKIRFTRPGRAMAAILTVATFTATGFVFTAGVDADIATVETLLIQRINAGRAAIGKPALVAHAGLRDKQRGHAAYMSSIDRLTHDGMSERHDSATPDPAELNGAPDDGFTGWLAENTLMNYRQGRTDAQLAEVLYQQWYNSPGHKRNMLDESNAGYTVTGIGVFEGNGKVWAAQLLAVDRTLPTSAPVAPPRPTTPVPPVAGPMCPTASPSRSQVLGLPPVLASADSINTLADTPTNRAISKLLRQLERAAGC